MTKCLQEDQRHSTSHLHYSSTNWCNFILLCSFIDFPFAPVSFRFCSRKHHKKSILQDSLTQWWFLALFDLETRIKPNDPVSTKVNLSLQKLWCNLDVLWRFHLWEGNTFNCPDRWFLACKVVSHFCTEFCWKAHHSRVYPSQFCHQLYHILHQKVSLEVYHLSCIPLWDFQMKYLLFLECANEEDLTEKRHLLMVEWWHYSWHWFNRIFRREWNICCCLFFMVCQWF